jgi:signal transduction histidine kinase
MYEAGLVFGYLIFGWPAMTAEGRRRYDDHTARRIMDTLLQSLTYRRASLQQQALAGRVFSMIAHNLGSPIFQLCSDARVLKDGFLEGESLRRRLRLGGFLDGVEERRLDKYHQLLRQSRHMRGIVDAILSIDGRKIERKMATVSVASVVYDVVRTVRKEAEGWATIDYTRPDEETLKKQLFYTDEIRVYDIMLNLLTNAVKYSPQGGTIQVQAVVTTHGAELRVRDEGHHIPSDERKRIFQPFVRGQQAKSEGIPGLGLGLYVVDLYAKALDGRVGIVQEAGPGKSFAVFLPRIPEPPEDEVAEEEEEEES